MKKITFLLLFALLPIAVSAYNLKRVSVHDPSIVWDSLSSTYYIFGTHRGAAKTKDLMSWTSFRAPWKTATSSNAANSAAFKTNQTKTVTIKGEEVAFGNFDVHAWSAAYGNYNIDGNLWAPDVIYNKKMKKWCMYMSVNGPTWNSSIVLLTADKIASRFRQKAFSLIFELREEQIGSNGAEHRIAKKFQPLVTRKFIAIESCRAMCHRHLIYGYILGNIPKYRIQYKIRLPIFARKKPYLIYQFPKNPISPQFS